MPSSVPASAAVELDDLAAAGRRVVGVGRRLAVHAQVACGLLDHAVGLAGDDEASVGQADVQRLAAAPQREQERVRARRRVLAADGDRALEAPRRSRGTPRRSTARGRARRDTSVGMTLASVVIAAAMRRPSAAMRSAKLSTSPLSTRGHERPVGRRPTSSALSGWAFGSEMMPTAPSGCGRARCASASAPRSARRSSSSPRIASRSDRGVVAQLADLGRGLVDEDELTRRPPAPSRR